MNIVLFGLPDDDGAKVVVGTGLRKTDARCELGGYIVQVVSENRIHDFWLNDSPSGDHGNNNESEPEDILHSQSFPFIRQRKEIVNSLARDPKPEAEELPGGN